MLCSITIVCQHPDNLVTRRFGAFEVVVKCGEMRLLRLSLLSSHQAARTESESAEGAWQRDTFWKNIQSGTGSEEYRKLRDGRSGRKYKVEEQEWEIIQSWRGGWQTCNLFSISSSAPRKTEPGLSSHSQLQKSSGKLKLFLHHAPKGKLCVDFLGCYGSKNCSVFFASISFRSWSCAKLCKKIAICIYVGVLWLQFRRDLGIDRMKDWIFQGTTERVENIFTCQLMEWRPTLPWSGIEFWDQTWIWGTTEVV